MYTNIIHNDDICNYSLKNKQIIFNSLGNCRECRVYNAGVFFNFEGKTSGLKNLIMDTAFKSITIKKIAIETQRSIATVLSTIESKMAANRAINHYLAA